jgi:very-short-patch-repair endonuclease
MATLLSSGGDAALSYVTAAAAWAVLGLRSGPIHITVPRCLHSRPGLVVHHAHLPDDEVTVEDGLRVTTVPRTLFDLASVLDFRQLESACNEAEVRRLTDPLSLQDLVERHPHSRGVAHVRRLLTERTAGMSATRSQLERDFLAFRRDNHLPVPEVNAKIQLTDRTYFADFLWSESRLIAELDSRGFHLTTRAFEADRERDRLLAVAGWHVIRITWRQLHIDPDRLAADLHALLSAHRRAAGHSEREQS